MIESTVTTTPGERLRAARKKAGFKTAREAWERFGWNANTYRAHEAGPREYGKKAAIVYARAFDVGVAWLLTGSDDRVEGSSPTIVLPLQRRRQAGLNELASVIETMYGPRCARSVGGCTCCAVWSVFDALAIMTDGPESST